MKSALQFLYRKTSQKVALTKLYAVCSSKTLQQRMWCGEIGKINTARFGGTTHIHTYNKVHKTKMSFAAKEAKA